MRMIKYTKRYNCVKIRLQQDTMRVKWWNKSGRVEKTGRNGAGEDDSNQYSSSQSSAICYCYIKDMRSSQSGTRRRVTCLKMYTGSSTACHCSKFCVVR